MTNKLIAKLQTILIDFYSRVKGGNLDVTIPQIDRAYKEERHVVTMDIIRKKLLEAKINALEQVQILLCKEIDTYKEMLRASLTPEDEGYTGSQEQA